MLIIVFRHMIYRYCLMFRVADMRNSTLISANIRAAIVYSEDVTEEVGKPAAVKLCQHGLKLTTGCGSGDETFLYLAWPATVVHNIDVDSPLWQLSAAELRDSAETAFELIVILEGTVESTGMTTQVGRVEETTRAQCIRPQCILL